MRGITAAIVTAMILGLAEPAAAATQRDLENGIELIQREHYTDAHALLDPLAALEDREALYRTGRLYEENKGLPAQALDEHDRLAEAGRRYALAARQGHVDAAYRLGQMHLRGVGVARDPVLAARLLRQAADGDHGKAQYEYGSLLAAGIGVRQDEFAALAWYLIAAERNDVTPAEMAAQAMCDRLRRKMDLAIEAQLRLERPDQRFRPYYTKRAHIDRYEILPEGIRLAMARAVDFTPEGPGARKGRPSLPDNRCFTGEPES